MKKLFALSTLAALSFAGSAMAESWTGFVSDAHCKHDGSTAKDAACSKTCIEKKGSDAVFVSDGKVLKFDAASEAKAKEMAGEKVTIDGTLKDDTVTINSITKAAS